MNKKWMYSPWNWKDRFGVDYVCVMNRCYHAHDIFSLHLLMAHCIFTLVKKSDFFLDEISYKLLLYIIINSSSRCLFLLELLKSKVKNMNICYIIIVADITGHISLSRKCTFFLHSFILFIHRPHFASYMIWF